MMELNEVHLNEARQAVRKYISDWTEEKLCAVLAFCEDGKMDYFQSCSCLIGVASSEVLHAEYCGGMHYSTRRQSGIDLLENIAQRGLKATVVQNYYASVAEMAYYRLGCEMGNTRYTPAGNLVRNDSQIKRDREFAAIIRDVLEEKSVASGPQFAASHHEVGVVHTGSLVCLAD